MESIITKVNRPSDELLKKFEGLSSALMHESLGKRGALTNDFKSIYPGAKFFGCALPIKGFPGDNLMLHKAISIAQPGDVLIATVNGFTEAGLWGEITSVAAQKVGIRALVTDGSVRDTAEIAKLGFPVFSRGISIKGTTKRQSGLINHPIIIGGIRVEPGDIVIGDSDGVVVIPLKEAESALKRAKEIIEFESKIIDEIHKGKRTIELLGLQTVLKELGLEETDFKSMANSI